METIHWVIIMLGFSIVFTGLRFAFNFIRNEEKKKNMIETAYVWKAKMEEATIQKEGVNLKEAA